MIDQTLRSQITSRLPNVGTTIFTKMSTLASELKAVNLGQGFPDFEMNAALVDKVVDAMRSGYNQYAPMPGYPPLMEAIARKVESLYGAVINPSTEVTITPGGTYAIYSALTCILRPGDEVIVFEPAYDSYIPNVEINGAKAVTINLTLPDYLIDWHQVRAAINSRTRAIILNSPHNPTGAVLTDADMRELSSIVNSHDIFIVSDEVYEHIIFDGLDHLSILRYPDLRTRAFVCFSFGKVYNCTGWKLGYCIAPESLMKEFRKIHQFNAFSSFTPTQVALSEFLSSPEHYLSLPEFYQRKRDLFVELMGPSRFVFRRSLGSYFICASYERISNERDEDFAVRITREAGVATIPVSVFYRSGKDDHIIRFSFCKKDETLEKAAQRLCKI